MKKVLILAYDFPPYVSVGGLRPYSWYKYLNELDVYPTVITRQWGNKYGNHLDYITPSQSDKILIEETKQGTIIRTPYKPNLANKIMLKYGDNKFKVLRKLISAFYELFQWVFNIGPKIQLYFATKEYLKNNKVDVIIATAEPFILFRYASKLSQEFNTPWIADYRDTWSSNKLRAPNLLLKIFYTFVENKYVKTADLITTVSGYLKNLIAQTLKVNLPSEIIINGFDDALPNKFRDITQSSKILNIALAGTIYKWHPIESVFNICSQFVNENKTIQLNFYGVNIEKELQDLLKTNFPILEKSVTFYPKIDNELLVKELSKSNIMLLFNDYFISGTKIYDYLAVKRKILFCFTNEQDAKVLKHKYYSSEDNKKFNNHLQEDIIKETNSGILIENTTHLKNVLQELYLEHNKNGFIECNSYDIEKYNRKLQVEKLARLIKNL